MLGLTVLLHRCTRLLRLWSVVDRGRDRVLVCTWKRVRRGQTLADHGCCASSFMHGRICCHERAVPVEGSRCHLRIQLLQS